MARICVQLICSNCHLQQEYPAAVMSEKQAVRENIRGLPCLITPWYTRQKYEDAMDFVPGEGDLILASHRKTGTTWLQYIILQIKSKGDLFPTFDAVNYKLFPHIEVTGPAAVHAQEKPRCYKSHLPYTHLQKNDKAKYIYVYRNPEDTFASLYHYSVDYVLDAPIDFNSLFNDFLTGGDNFGNYFQHVLSYFEHREDLNLLIVSYEMLQANRMDEILRIAKFMGADYCDTLRENQQVLRNIIENTSFGNMKNKLAFSHPAGKVGVSQSPGCEASKVNFFGKGIVGDGKAVLSEVQRRSLKEAAAKVLEGTPILNEWYPE